MMQWITMSTFIIQRANIRMQWNDRGTVNVSISEKVLKMKKSKSKHVPTNIGHEDACIAKLIGKVSNIYSGTRI